MATSYPATMRARDTDRANTCATLDSGLDDGQLTEDEHRQRVAQAMSAKTLGELHTLIGDLQGDTDLAPVRTPIVTLRRPDRFPRWIPAVIALVIVVVAVIALVRSCGSSSSPGAADTFGNDGYLTLAGLESLVDATRAEFGDTVVDELTVYPTYAVFERADPTVPRRKLLYRYDGEWGEPSTSGTRDPKVEPIDLQRVNMVKMAGLLAGAAESLHLAQISTIYLILRAADNGPEAVLHATSPFEENGHLTADLDGRFTSVYPFEPGK